MRRIGAEGRLKLLKDESLDPARREAIMSFERRLGSDTPPPGLFPEKADNEGFATPKSELARAARLGPLLRDRPGKEPAVVEAENKGQRNGMPPDPAAEGAEPGEGEPHPDWPGVVAPGTARDDAKHYEEFRDPEILTAIDKMLLAEERLLKMLNEGWWLKRPPAYLARWKGVLIDANRAVKKTKV